jgi:hypothetical protein
MELPVKFPSDTEVILEEVARFRRLSPRERIRTILDMVDFGARLQRMSPNSAWMRGYTEDQERLAQQRIREFIARHGR